MKRLRIYPGTETEWALTENDEMIDSGIGNSFPHFDECEVVVPFSLVSLTRAKLPKVNPRRLAEIAPFAVEDAVISEPERNLVVPGRKLQDDTTVLAVVDREWMKGLLSALGNSGIEPKRVVPELLLPPLQTGNWALVLNGSEGFLKTSEHAAFILDANGNMPPLGLKLALQKEERPERIIVHAKDIPDLAHWEQMLGIPLQAAEPWDWKRADCKNGFSLLGAASSRSIEIDWRPFKPAIFVIFMMILLQFSGTVYEWVSLSHEKKAIFAEMDGIFRESFPEARVVVDAPLQMRRK
ncbi:MAG TPA: type II secretion system protein GspL, partial [Burkholderiales bacterium]|nr:type II secretion system protein GspL [Burkholderiales bacterium]